jgi:hypothetical protein
MPVKICDPAGPPLSECLYTWKPYQDGKDEDYCNDPRQ